MIADAKEYTHCIGKAGKTERIVRISVKNKLPPMQLLSTNKIRLFLTKTTDSPRNLLSSKEIGTCQPVVESLK